jgi:hypothetical protein
MNRIDDWLSGDADFVCGDCGEPCHGMLDGLDHECACQGCLMDKQEFAHDRLEDEAD